MSTTTSTSNIAPSSSTTLWATASKEWVIQPKPKPGRKPKKEHVSAVKEDGEESDTKGRRMQNRAAQRAFRERKQSQLAELQARLQSYEQGEIERNVALQNIAKRLKEENERLRQENATLQAKLAQMQQQQQPASTVQEFERKRVRDETPSPAFDQFHVNKKSRSASEPETSTTSSSITAHLPSPASLGSTPSPDYSDNQDHSYRQIDSEVPNFTQFDTKAITSDVSSFAFTCGFCDETTLCMCREIAVNDLSVSPMSTADIKFPILSESPVNGAFDQTHPDKKPSILDNLPAYQPPVPLRKKTNHVQVNSIFPVTTASSESQRNVEAMCTGDPTNCAACADDDFGKAFCSAISNSSASRTTCDCCPSRTQADSVAVACKNESSCSGCPSSTKPPELLDPEPTSSEFIPTNNAWQQIKMHPNVEFADLALLAEVVASRSKCEGPQIILPQSSRSAGQHPDSSFNTQRNRRDSPPPRLVPEEILLACGRRNMRTVHADGVRDALRLLDAKFT
ncbi:hypothetical protein CVT24_000880 [Panaeolus cyanescens]|uniref:BZIP domain-containing protein n=1 Tax=Panaeolus cyanescens TaxID=181874 RepID=A0A409YCB5_9AGAR|nr:hypothetical protein CVT24_000880 [Panaeolus cyanescens]